MLNGFVAVHTLTVLWLVSESTFSKECQYTEMDINIIQWAALLHDVRKLQDPFIKGKDHVHPFKSAVAVLEVFQELGLLECSTTPDSDFSQICRLLRESV